MSKSCFALACFSRHSSFQLTLLRMLQLANGAVIVDPFLGSVIAWGHDQCTNTTNSPAQAKENRVRHSLRHAVMEVISMAADRDRLLFPSNATSSCPSESDAAAEFGSATKKARMDMVSILTFSR